MNSQPLCSDLLLFNRDNSDVGHHKEDWEGPPIILEEFQELGWRGEENKPKPYDFWIDLGRFKAGFIIAQLLEISPITKKALKYGALVVQRNRKRRTRVVARLQPTEKPFVVKIVEIDVTLVDKVIPNTLVDKGSRLNIMPL